MESATMRTDLTARQFGRLTVTHYSETRGGVAFWFCKCECGTELFEARAGSLRTGDTKSCGCLLRENGARNGRMSASHAHSHSENGGPSPTYNSWAGMLQRCSNPKHKGYSRYGGRGIKVCERWQKFENFLADMGERPAGKTLDRFPNRDGDYEPGNARWATNAEQSSNRKQRDSWLRNQSGQFTEAAR
jgi:hypothetical protein